MSEYPDATPSERDQEELNTGGWLRTARSKARPKLARLEAVTMEAKSSSRPNCSGVGDIIANMRDLTMYDDTDSDQSSGSGTSDLDDDPEWQ